jgi:hypothetical protein
MPAAAFPPPAAPAFVEADKPPMTTTTTSGGDVESGALPISSAAAPPPAGAVKGAALAPGGGGPVAPSSANRSSCSLAPSVVGWLLFALGWLIALVWIIGLPAANLSPSACGAQASRLLASPNPLAQLVNYERLRDLVTCRITTNIALVATGALCLVPWLLGSLIPCCCERKPHCSSLALAKSRGSRAAGFNTAMAVLGIAALAGLIAMCAVEVREGKKMDTPEQRAQLEQLARVARTGQEAATAVDGILEQVTQALGISPVPGVGSAASGDGLLGRLFKP